MWQRIAPLALLASVLISSPATAQIKVGAATRTPSDTLRRGPAPLGYFFRSLLIPGWGQASLDRKLTGALFIGMEGLSLSMAMKTSTELRYLEKTDTAAARERRGEKQDWIVLVVFNHLFSALEAYVSAHLVDFPRDLHLRAFPGRRPGIGFTVGH